MKHLIILCVVLAMAGCSSNPTGAEVQTPTKSDNRLAEASRAIPEMSGLKLASAITNGNVTVYPVTTSKPQQKDLDDMITLDEARRKGWVIVVEQEDETVEVLQVINKGPKAIFLMAGEVLLGGKQDRVISEDTIVRAGETAEVKVFCVDQGRWSGGDEFAPSAMQATKDVKEAAMLDKDQGKVWAKVESVNQRVAGLSPAREVAEGGSLKITVNSQEVKARQADAASVVRDILKVKDVVGLVTVINGKLYGFEYFGSNKFFGKALPSILNGVFADSLLAKSEAEKGQAGSKEAAEFVTDCLKGRTTGTINATSYCYFQTDSGRSRGSSTWFGGKAKGEQEVKAGGGLLRGSYIAK